MDMSSHPVNLRKNNEPAGFKPNSTLLGIMSNVKNYLENTIDKDCMIIKTSPSFC